MFGPVQAAGDQLNGGGGIHQMDHPLEAKGKTRPTIPAKAGMKLFKMAQDGIEEILGHLGGAFPIGAGERILAGRGRATHRRERSRMQPQGIADIVETDGVGQLGVEQTHDMTPRRERAGAFGDAGVPRQLGHQMRRNKIAELVQEREAAARWLVRCGFIHPLPCGRFTRGKPTLFYPSSRKPVGLLWFRFIGIDTRANYVGVYPHSVKRNGKLFSLSWVLAKQISFKLNPSLQLVPSALKLDLVGLFKCFAQFSHGCVWSKGNHWEIIGDFPSGNFNFICVLNKNEICNIV